MQAKTSKAATAQNGESTAPAQPPPPAAPSGTMAPTAPICRHCSRQHSLVCTSCGRTHGEHTFADGIVRPSRSGQQYELVCERYTQVPQSPKKKTVPQTAAADEVAVASPPAVSNVAFPEGGQLIYKRYGSVSMVDSIPTDRGGLTLIATRLGEMFWVRSTDITVIVKEEVTA